MKSYWKALFLRRLSARRHEAKHTHNMQFINRKRLPCQTFRWWCNTHPKEPFFTHLCFPLNISHTTGRKLQRIPLRLNFVFPKMLASGPMIPGKQRLGYYPVFCKTCNICTRLERRPRHGCYIQRCPGALEGFCSSPRTLLGLRNAYRISSQALETTELHRIKLKWQLSRICSASQSQLSITTC